MTRLFKGRRCHTIPKMLLQCSIPRWWWCDVSPAVWWWWWCWCTSVKIGKIVWIWEYDPGPMQIVPKCGKYRKIAASCTTLVYAHWMNVLSTDLQLFYNPCVLMRLLCFEKHVLLITSLFAALAISLFFVSCVSTSKWLSARLVQQPWRYCISVMRNVSCME